jgi:hypothetical protein
MTRNTPTLASSKQTLPARKKLVLSRETVRSLNEPLATEAVTWCECATRCTCTTNLC